MANNIPKTRKHVEKIKKGKHVAWQIIYLKHVEKMKKGKHVAWQIIIDHLPYLSILFFWRSPSTKIPFRKIPEFTEAWSHLFSISYQNTISYELNMVGGSPVLGDHNTGIPVLLTILV